MDLEPIDWEWKAGSRITWLAQRPTRVLQFEVRKTSNDFARARVMSLRVGHMEQLADATLPDWQGAPVFVLFHAGLVLPVLEVGAELSLLLRGFHGEIRPIGEQVP